MTVGSREDRWVGLLGYSLPTQFVLHGFYVYVAEAVRILQDIDGTYEQLDIKRPRTVTFQLSPLGFESQI